MKKTYFYIASIVLLFNLSFNSVGYAVNNPPVTSSSSAASSSGMDVSQIIAQLKKYRDAANPSAVFLKLYKRGMMEYLDKISEIFSDATTKELIVSIKGKINSFRYRDDLRYNKLIAKELQKLIDHLIDHLNGLSAAALCADSSESPLLPPLPETEEDTSSSPSSSGSSAANLLEASLLAAVPPPLLPGTFENVEESDLPPLPPFPGEGADDFNGTEANEAEVESSAGFIQGVTRPGWVLVMPPNYGNK